MTNIVINRVNLEVLEKTINLSLFREEDINDIVLKLCLKRYKPSYLFEELKKNKSIQEDSKTLIIDWINLLKKNDPKDEKYIFISFLKQSEECLNISSSNLDNFTKAYIKESLIQFLKRKYIIEPFKVGCDFCIYEYMNEEKYGFKKYRRYDIVIHSYYSRFEKRRINELSISIGSQDSYIGFNNSIMNEISDITNCKILIDNMLVNSKNQVEKRCYIKANNEIKKLLEITSRSRRTFYKYYYKQINNFADDLANKLELSNLKIFNKLIHKNPKDIKIVDFEKNKMIFKGDKLDYSTINGMRDHGPFKVPININEYKLLFIYPDSDSANKLYTYFSRGYRHFPGLESYVNIPANISEIKIKYEKLDNLSDKISNILKEDQYHKLIAVCIIPFSKSNATKQQYEIYYKIKELLLSKNISSQFIDREKIFREDFHFYLPNIAIAMLAKIGGIPWKLPRKSYKQLTIGLNVYKKDNRNYLGSAIYFDNEGKLHRVEVQKANLENLLNIINSSIEEYSRKNNFDKMVIHYYKPFSKEEQKSIEKYIKPSIPYAFLEINDTRTTTDICFDLNYDLLMPQSGTYIWLKPNEYLLFNNLRYWERPTNPIYQEELPIKLRIYDPTNSFDHYEHELISQIYEFSRLYWKGLKQKAHPVTIIYSKLAAQYVANFQHNILTDSKVAQETVWFI